MRATVVFWTWPLYDTPSAGFFVSLAGLVNAFNVCVRVWKGTDGDIAYLSEKGLLLAWLTMKRSAQLTYTVLPLV